MNEWSWHISNSESEWSICRWCCVIFAWVLGPECVLMERGYVKFKWSFCWFWRWSRPNANPKHAKRHELPANCFWLDDDPLFLRLRWTTFCTGSFCRGLYAVSWHKLIIVTRSINCSKIIAVDINDVQLKILLLVSGPVDQTHKNKTNTQ